MFYIYRHIRLDNNTVFYIGKGRYIKGSKSNKALYKRAFSKSLRNTYWNNIVNKTNYKVEIIFESDSEDVINEKEMEFIKLYGRNDLGLGTLCNLTDGSDGGKGSVKSKEFKEMISKRFKGIPKSENQKRLTSLTHKGKKISQREIDAMIDANSKLILDMSTGIYYKNTKEASLALCINRGHLSNMLAGFRRNKTNLLRV